MQCGITNPVSSNQVVEVGLFKPRCATFEGNSLNDWLKWLAEKQCEIDWTTFDLSCLQSLLTTVNTCEQTQKIVIQSIIDSICQLKTLNVSESLNTVEPEHGWTSTQTIRTLKKGSLVTLSGVVYNGNVTQSICTLPQECWPAYTIRIPVYHENSYVTTYAAYLQITSSGVVSLAFRGTSPSITNSQPVYLDGISFMV